MSTTAKSLIQQYIAAGELAEALDVFSAAAAASAPRLSNDLLLLTARWNGLRRQINQGMIPENVASMETNKIQYAVVDLLDRLPADAPVPAGVVVTPEPVSVTNDRPAQPDPPAAPAKPATKKILFLSSNPRDTARLRVNEELRDVELQLRLANQRDLFQLVPNLAVRTGDLINAINWEQPNIVHFAGHGEGDQGLVFEDNNGNARVVSTEALANLFELFSDRVECVVLNACYSEAQAQAILQHIPYVVGMRSAVPDGVAVRFAAAFYGGLASGRGVEYAFKLARVAVQVDGLDGSDIPVLGKKGA